MAKSLNLLKIVVSIIAAGVAVAGIASCGSNMMNNMTTRQLQSITVTPASATATSTSGGVQFMATGMYNMNPMTVMSPPVMWSVGNPFASAPVPAGVSVDVNGMVHCSGFMGMITIQATAPMDPNMPLSKMTMMTQNVGGMAQLTCQ